MVAAIGAGAALASTATSIGNTLSGSSKQSSDIAAGQAAANAAEQQALANYTTNEQPFISTGTNALSSLADADGLNGATGYQNALANFTASPGYQYQVQQGLSAIDNGAASTGTLRSGNTIRAEETLGSNLANQDFGAYLGRLNTLAGLGQTATTALGQAGISVGQGESGTATSAANSLAGITGSATKGISDAVTGLAGNKDVQNVLASTLMGKGTSTATYGANGTGTSIQVGNLY